MRLKIFLHRPTLAVAAVLGLMIQGALGAVTAAPNFSPPPGSYNDSVEVALTSATPGATIYYTTDGTDPTVAEENLYDPDLPVFLDANTVIKAIAVKVGNTDSTVAVGNYTVVDTTPAITVATPVFTPVAGTYNDLVQVTPICATPDATIYYTTDGSTPSEVNGEIFDSLFPIELTATTTVKAIAVRTGDTDSAVATATYTVIDTPPITVAAPVFTPAAGKYFDYVEVALTSATQGATIYYTIDGTNPTIDPDHQYFPEFPEFIFETTTVRAIAVRAGDTTSAMTVGTFRILPLPAPTLKVKGKTTLTVKKPTVTIRGTSTFADEVVYQIGKAKKFKSATNVNPWKIKANLKPGLNTISIKAVGPYEDSKVKKVKVSYKK